MPRYRNVILSSPSPDPAPPADQAVPRSPTPLRTRGPSADVETVRAPLQEGTNLPTRETRSKRTLSKAQPKKTKKKIARSPSPAPAPSENEGLTSEDDIINRRAVPQKRGAEAASNTLGAIPPEETRLEIIKYIEKMTVLRHLENVDKLAATREQTNAKELELQLTVAKTVLVQAQTEFVQTMERAHTADPVVAAEIGRHLESASERFAEMYTALANALLALSRLDNPVILKLRADVDRERNALLKTLIARLGQPGEFEAIVNVLQNERKTEMAAVQVRLSEAESLRYDARERWVRTMGTQMARVQPALLSLGGIQWKMMEVFLDAVREKFPEIVDVFEDESAALKG